MGLVPIDPRLFFNTVPFGALSTYGFPPCAEGFCFRFGYTYCHYVPPFYFLLGGPYRFFLISPSCGLSVLMVQIQVIWFWFLCHLFYPVESFRFSLPLSSPDFGLFASLTLVSPCLRTYISVRLGGSGLLKSRLPSFEFRTRIQDLFPALWCPLRSRRLTSCLGSVSTPSVCTTSRSGWRHCTVYVILFAPESGPRL